MSACPGAIDLFAGAGGATQGLKLAGLNVLAAVELDPSAAESFQLNHPEVDLRAEDIREVDAGGLRTDLGLDVGELALLKACPPCQGFSTLGSGDEEDDRNDLVTEVWRFIREFQPVVWVLENVPGIRNDERLRQVIRSSRGLGYSVGTYTVQAVDFGVPQWRKRHIVIGAQGIANGMPAELFDFFEDEFPVDPVPAGTALEVELEPGDPLDVGRTLQPTTARRVAAVPIGGNRFDLPKELTLDCHDRMDVRNATGPYGRVKLDEPAPTMTTRCTTPSCGSFIHPTEDRGLTLREAALFQTFPPTYQFAGTYGSIEAQIGNAVPVELAHALGRAVLGLVDSMQPAG